MDVNMLLNEGARSARCRPSIEDLPQSSEKVSTRRETELESPGETAAREDGGDSRSRTPWNAGGYALPPRVESTSQSTPIFSPSSPRESQESHSTSRTTSRTRSLSRHWSTDSSMDFEPQQRQSSLTRAEPTRKLSSTDRGNSDYSMELFRRKSSTRDEYSNFIRDSAAASRHRLSISNSSLSSYGSSQSGYHSRLSSITTVSGISSSLSVLEIPHMEPKFLEYNERFPEYIDEEPQSPLSSLPEENSPHTSGDSEGTERPRSPSDAVLNLKGLVKPLLDTSNQRSHRPIQRPKLHQRAISAPTFALLSAHFSSNTLKHRYPGLTTPQRLMDRTNRRQKSAELAESEFGMITTRQRSGSEHNESTPDHVSGFRVGSFARPNTDSPPIHSESFSPSKADQIVDIDAGLPRHSSTSALPSAIGNEPSCMFVENCQTGSQLRKAISHLFGRNKSCTLRIPKQVWVYYCRKHYQRIRYRNAKTYPLTQMSLVKTQIERLQTWSDENQHKKDGPYIRFWSLTLRKREQNRLDKEGGGDEGDEEISGVQNSGAAPDWLVQRLGTGYTTRQMLEVAGRLHEEIEQGVLLQIPEIEFLPDIIDPEEGISSKSVRGRKPSRIPTEAKATKRKISEVTIPSGRAEDGSPAWRDVDDQLISPMEKRPRLDSFHGHHSRRLSFLPPPSSAISKATDPFGMSSDSTHSSDIPRSMPTVQRRESYDFGSAPSVENYSAADPYHSGVLNSSYEHQMPPNYQFGANVIKSSPARQKMHPVRHRRLPSLTAQMPEQFDFRSRYPPPQFVETHNAHMSGQNSLRPLRHRSVSAYVPVRQSDFAASRLTSSGSGSPVEVSPLKRNSLSMPTYESVNRAYPSEHWQAPEYSYGLAPANGGLAPPQQVSQSAPRYEQVHYRQTNHPSSPTNASSRLPLAGPERAVHPANGSGVWQHSEQSVDMMTREERET